MLVNVDNANYGSGSYNDWSPSENDVPVSNGSGVKVTFGDGYESDNPNFNVYEVEGEFIAHHIQTDNDDAWTLGPVKFEDGVWKEIDTNYNSGPDDGPGYEDGQGYEDSQGGIGGDGDHGDGDHGDGIDSDDFLAEPSVTNLPITLPYDAGNVWSREDGNAGVFTQGGSVSGTVAFALLDSAGAMTASQIEALQSDIAAKLIDISEGNPELSAEEVVALVAVEFDDSVPETVEAYIGVVPNNPGELAGSPAGQIIDYVPYKVQFEGESVNFVPLSESDMDSDDGYGDEFGSDWSPSENDVPVSNGSGVKVTFGDGYESDNPNFNVYEVEGELIAHHIQTDNDDAWTLGPVKFEDGVWKEIDTNYDSGPDDGPGYEDGQGSIGGDGGHQFEDDYGAFVEEFLERAPTITNAQVKASVKIGDEFIPASDLMDMKSITFDANISGDVVVMVQPDFWVPESELESPRSVEAANEIQAAIAAEINAAVESGLELFFVFDELYEKYEESNFGYTIDIGLKLEAQKAADLTGMPDVGDIFVPVEFDGSQFIGIGGYDGDDHGSGQGGFPGSSGDYGSNFGTSEDDVKTFAEEEMSDQWDGRYYSAGGGDDTVTGSNGRDDLLGEAGNDRLLGGDGADNLDGGSGDDYLDGGADGTSEFHWENNDRASYDGNKSDYQIENKTDDDIGTVTGVANKEYFTIQDLVASDGDEGTDILVNIEELNFANDNVKLVPETHSHEWSDDWSGVTIKESNTYGTPFDDIILGSANVDWENLRGEEGNDVILGDGLDPTADGAASGDNLSGGMGNDFIDGGARGTSDDNWRNFNRLELDAPQRRIAIEEYEHGSGDLNALLNGYLGLGDIIDGDGKLLTLVNDTELELIEGQKYYVISDSLEIDSGGLGTDLVTNIDEISYQDHWESFGLNVWLDQPYGDEIFGSNVNGGDFDDMVTATELQNLGYDYDMSQRDNIQTEGGDDVIFAGTGGDHVNPGSGNDFIDGGTGAAPALDGMDMWHDNSSDDTVQYQGKVERYTVSELDLTAAGALVESLSLNVDLSEYSNSDVFYKVVDSKGGKKSDGTDLLVNIENISFSDNWQSLTVSFRKDDWTPPGEPSRYSWDGTGRSDIINVEEASEEEYDADSRDWISAREGNDIVSSGGGGDQIEGGVGNDIINGGANGDVVQGQEWMARDEARYSGNYDRFTVNRIELADDIETIISNSLNIETFTISGSSIFMHDENGDKNESASYTFDSGVTSVFSVVDSITSEYGGLGVDIVGDVEGLSFNDQFLDLSVRIEAWNPDGEAWVNGTEFSDIIDLRAGVEYSEPDYGGGHMDGGPIGDDHMVASLAEDHNLDIINDINIMPVVLSASMSNMVEEDNETSEDTAVILHNSAIMPEAGDDIVLAGPGADRIEGSLGDDFYHGGSQLSLDPENPWDTWNKYDQVNYQASSARFDILEGWTLVVSEEDQTPIKMAGEFVFEEGASAPDAPDTGVWVSALRVSDILPDIAGGEGVDILVDIEAIGFDDDYQDLTVRYDSDYRYENNDLGNFDYVEVNARGTFKSEILVGDNAPKILSGEDKTSYLSKLVDNLRGEAGNDILVGGASGDFLEGEQGDDILIGGTFEGDSDYISDFDPSGDDIFYASGVWLLGDQAKFDGEFSRFSLDQTYVTIDDEYNVTEVAQSEEGAQSAFTVTDNLSDEAGGLGRDILVGIEQIRFNGSDSSTNINLTPELTAREHWEDPEAILFLVEGTLFDDNVDAQDLIDASLIDTSNDEIRWRASYGDDNFISIAGVDTEVKYRGADFSDFVISGNSLINGSNEVTVSFDGPGGKSGQYGTSVFKNVSALSFEYGSSFSYFDLGLRINEFDNVDFGRNENVPGLRVEGTILNDSVILGQGSLADYSSENYAIEIDGSSGDDTFTGGALYDQITYEFSEKLAVISQLEDGSLQVQKLDANGVVSGTDTVSGFERLRFKDGNSTTEVDLVLNGQNDYADGTQFDDVVTNQDLDTLDVEQSERYFVDVGAGDDSVTLSGGKPRIYTGLGSDYVTFTSDLGETDGVVLYSEDVLNFSILFYDENDALVDFYDVDGSIKVTNTVTGDVDTLVGVSSISFNDKYAWLMFEDGVSLSETPVWDGYNIDLSQNVESESDVIKTYQAFLASAQNSLTIDLDLYDPLNEEDSLNGLNSLESVLSLNSWATAVDWTGRFFSDNNRTGVEGFDGARVRGGSGDDLLIGTDFIDQFQLDGGDDELVGGGQPLLGSSDDGFVFRNSWDVDELWIRHASSDEFEIEYIGDREFRDGKTYSDVYKLTHNVEHGYGTDYITGIERIWFKADNESYYLTPSVEVWNDRKPGEFVISGTSQDDHLDSSYLSGQVNTSELVYYALSNGEMTTEKTELIVQTNVAQNTVWISDSGAVQGIVNGETSVKGNLTFVINNHSANNVSQVQLEQLNATIRDTIDSWQAQAPDEVFSAEDLASRLQNDWKNLVGDLELSLELMVDVDRSKSENSDFSSKIGIADAVNEVVDSDDNYVKGTAQNVGVYLGYVDDEWSSLDGVLPISIFRPGAGDDKIIGANVFGNMTFSEKLLVGNDLWQYTSSVELSGSEQDYSIQVKQETDTDANFIGDNLSLSFDPSSPYEYFEIVDLRENANNSGTDFVYGVERVEFRSTTNSTKELVSVYRADKFDSHDNGQQATVWELTVSDSFGNDNYASLVDDFEAARDMDSDAWRVRYDAAEGDDQYYGFESSEYYTSGRNGDRVAYNASIEFFEINLISADKESGTKVIVTDSRDSGYGTDTLYNIESIEFFDPLTSSWDSVELVPEFNDWDQFEYGIDGYRGTQIGDILIADSGRNDIEGYAGDDVIIGGIHGDFIRPGDGYDFVHGGFGEGPVPNGADEWRYRNEVEFEVPFNRVNVLEVYAEVDENGYAKRNSDGSFIYGAEQTGGAVSAFLVQDTLPIGTSGSIGENILINVDNISFNDQWIELSGRSDERDWDGDGVIDEVFKQGTPLNDVLTGSTGQDYLEGREGNDILLGDAGGDNLRGGEGNDFINGGDNGNSGDPWRDLDNVEYNGIRDRYTVEVLSVDGAKSILGETLTAAVDWDQVGTLYKIEDILSERLGGTGIDIVTNVERIRFRDEEIDLGLRISSWDWDDDGAVDHSEIRGTDQDDRITSDTVSDLSNDDDIRGRAGDDVIYSGAGGDVINGGAGDDKIDGGEDGVEDEYGWVRKDEVRYDGPASRFTRENGTDTDGSITGVIGQTYFTITDSLPDALGGMGTDTVWNVEFISFTDMWVPLSVETFIERDENGTEIRRWVDGTVDDDNIDGGSGNDDLFGSDGNDILIGRAGGDWLNGGFGDDLIIGGTNGLDDYGNPMVDRARFDGDFSEYTVEEIDYTIPDAVFTKVSAVFDSQSVTAIQVTHNEDDGTGTDIVLGVEALEFDGYWLRVGVEYHTNYDHEGVETGQHIWGSILGDSIIGGALGDWVEGDAGNDIISTGDGADYIIGGAGNDTIDGGADGLDPWGNAGEDVVSFSGILSRYTVSFYDENDQSVSGFDSDGYVVVTDSVTVDNGGEGTDTLRNIERLDFSDTSLSFQINNEFEDFDGDGFPDLGIFNGTNGDDIITGSELDEAIRGMDGNDVLIGKRGGDLLEGGAGNDVLAGGANGFKDAFGNEAVDVAKFDANISDASVEAIFVAVSLEDGSYEIDSSDSAQWYLKTYDNADAAVTTGFNIQAALTVTIGSETDLLAGVEELEFNDGFVSTQVSTERFDLNGDNKKDLIVSGTLSDDVLDYSESTRDIFADLGPGNDSIRTGSGDGFYRLGLGNDVVEDLSDQDFDVVELSGNSDTWSKSGDTWSHETNGTATLTNIEAIDFDDKRVIFEISQEEKDTDKDGIVDKVVITGLSTDDNINESTNYESGTSFLIIGSDGDDILTGGSSGDLLDGGSGSDILIGGANEGRDAQNNPNMDIAIYAGTGFDVVDSSGTVISSADYTVDKGYVTLDENDLPTSTFSTSVPTDGTYIEGFSVTDAENAVDILVGIELIEFTDGTKSIAPRSVSAAETTVSGQQETITTVGSEYGEMVKSSQENDFLIGQGGADSFCFETGFGNDQILDFSLSDLDSDEDGTTDVYGDFISVCLDENDQINGLTIEKAQDMLQYVKSSSNGALIDLNGDTIVLPGIDADDLTADHFIIA